MLETYVNGFPLFITLGDQVGDKSVDLVTLCVQVKLFVYKSIFSNKLAEDFYTS